MEIEGISSQEHAEFSPLNDVAPETDVDKINNQVEEESAPQQEPADPVVEENFKFMETVKENVGLIALSVILIAIMFALRN